jgi:hypothetical protein
LLIYERGGYHHPLHPINNKTAASPEILLRTNHLLETFTQAIQIIQRNVTKQIKQRQSHSHSNGQDQLFSAMFYRLDVMEEKGYEGVETLAHLQLTRDQLPAVVMLKGYLSSNSLF